MASRKVQGTAVDNIKPEAPDPVAKALELLGIRADELVPLKSASFQQLVRIPGTSNTAQRIVIGSSASHVNVDTMGLDPERGLIIATWRGAVQVYSIAGADMEIHMEAIA